MHGQPFEPDGQWHLILDQAAKIAAGFVRTLLYKPRDRRAYFYEDSSWKTAFVGGSHEFLADRARLLDFRAMMHYVGTGITPAMTHAAVGVGSQYAYTAEDANGAWLEGAKDSTPTLPAPIPVKAFWAIDIYDTKPAPCSAPTTPTRASTTATAPAPPRTTATPSSASGHPTIGSDVNWLRTVPGRSWFLILRLQGPSNPGSTKPGDPEISNQPDHAAP